MATPLCLVPESTASNLQSMSLPAKRNLVINEHTCSLEGNIIVVSAKEARYITTRGERCVLLGWALRACCIVAQVSKACLDGGADDLYAPFLCLVMVEQGMQLVRDRRQEPACPP